MSKGLLSGLVLFLITAIMFPYFVLDTAYNQDAGQVDPVLQTVNLGEMRVSPLYDEDKGMRAKDVVAEVTKQIMDKNKDKESDETYLIDFEFITLDGTKIKESALNTTNPIVKEVEFMVNVYNKEAVVGTDPVVLVNNASSVSSSRFRWELFTNEGEQVNNLEELTDVSTATDFTADVESLETRTIKRVDFEGGE